MCKAIRNFQNPTPRSSMLGALGLLCCLLCLPTSVEAQTRRVEETGFSTPEPPMGALSRPRLSQSLGTPEVSPQRKKKKPAPATQAPSALRLWLAAFCLGLPSPCPSPLGLDEQEERISRRPSWRGFVFFAMPPPRFI